MSVIRMTNRRRLFCWPTVYNSTTSGLFTARSRIRALYAVVAVCLTDKSRYCIKWLNIDDSPGTLVFWRQRSSWNSNGVTPSGGSKCSWHAGAGKIGDLWQFNQKSYAFYLSNGDIHDDLEWLLTTPNHSIFYILHRCSYHRNGWRYRLFSVYTCSVYSCLTACLHY